MRLVWSISVSFWTRVYYSILILIIHFISTSNIFRNISNITAFLYNFHIDPLTLSLCRNDFFRKVFCFIFKFYHFIKCINLPVFILTNMLIDLYSLRKVYTYIVFYIFICSRPILFYSSELYYPGPSTVVI